MTSSCVLHFSIGGYDYRRTARFRQSIHFSIIQVLFANHTCIDAPESRTNSRSSGLRVVAGKHLFSESEKNVALSCSFNLNTHLASFHAASRAPCSCLLLRPVVKFWSVGATLMRFTWANQSERRIMIMVSNFSVMCNSFCEIYTSDRFRMSELFRKIDEDLGGSNCWNTQPNCRVFDESYTTGLPVLSYDSCFFNMATALWSHPFQTFCWAVLDLAMCIGALFSKSATTLGLVEQAFWRVPFFTE